MHHWRQLIVAGIALWLSVAGLACGSSSTDLPYAERLVRVRADKDQAFLESGDSPVPPERRSEMLPLAYFPPDESYKVPAVLRPPTSPQPVIEMPTSQGLMRQMMRVGALEFNLKGRPLTLSAFMEVGSPITDRLFVPFTDLTTGTETYPGGRYLDIDRTASGIYSLDFNLAYNPYCYFDARYDCPYPPPENRLDLPVRAGERLPDAREASR